MICSSCNADNREGLKFCTECGTPLALRCPDCGAASETGQKFCGECGRAMATSASGTPPAVTALLTDPLTGSADASTASASAGSAGGPQAGQAPGAPAELRWVSVLFVDLVGFTPLSESRDAEDVRELLSRYYESASTVITRHGGIVEKFIGDAVMAVWGAPVAREDDAERAVRAALEVLAAVAAFGQDVGAPELRARAGLVTGQAAALENPGEGLVVGDRVNTAARIQSIADAGTLLVDESTRRATSAAIAYEDAGEHTVKGKAERLSLWRAVRVVAGVGGSDREQGLEVAFVGRDGELRLLKELFHGALDRGAARLVAVSGEAGIGKSRLRREFFNYVDGLSDTILWHLGRCLSHGSGVSYWALAEMVRQRLAITEEASTSEAAAKLDEGLERWVPDQPDREFLRPRLGALLGVAEPGLARDELFAGWRLFFERLAEHLPVALVFEDLQWADAGLLDFIEQLLDWAASSPIFILTLARPEIGAGREGWPAGRRGVTTLVLEPLDDAAMRALLESLVGGLPAAAADRIVGQAEGVPLYAIETVRALADRGALVDRCGRLTLVGELGELDVPASLSSLLAARIDALDPEERGLVKAMSVFGGSFPRSAAVALGGIREEHVDELLASLVRKQVLLIRAGRLSPDRGQYAFAQSLLRTVAYGSLSRQERKSRHLAAAEHLRRAFADDGEDVAEVIASHYLEAYRAAGDGSDAEHLRVETARALRRSARRAETVGAPESAAQTYLKAAELSVDELERLELTAEAGRMKHRAGEGEAATELLEPVAAAHRRAGRVRESALIDLEVGRALTQLGRAAEAAERLGGAIKSLEGVPRDADVANLNAQLGNAFLAMAEWERSLPALEAALELAEALMLADVLSRALCNKGIVFLSIGRPEEARSLLTGAAEIAQRGDVADELHRALANLANLEMQWDLPGAEGHWDAALAWARRLGRRRMESLSAANLMMARAFAGHWTSASQLGDELLDGNEDRAGAEFVYHQLGLAQLLRGEIAAARASHERVVVWEHTDDVEYRAIHHSLRVTLLRAEGSAQEALELGESLLPSAIETLGASNDAVRQAWPEALGAALDLGRLDRAQALIELLAERPPGHIPPYLNAQLARGRGLLAAAEARDDGAEEALRDAVARFDALQYSYWLAVARTDLAGWLLDHRREGEAEPLLEQASATLGALGAAPALSRARELSSKLADATSAG